MTTGERDTVIAESGLGQKYIGVKDSGNLQIHGAEKLHWTKLASTADRYNADTTEVFYDHLVSLLIVFLNQNY